MRVLECKYLMSWTGEIFAYDNGFLVLNDAFDDHINFNVDKMEFIMRG